MQSNLMLLIAAAIWGFGFVAQRLGMSFVEPFAFNSLRFLLGGLSLLPLIWWLHKRKSKSTQTSNKGLMHASFITGAILFIAATLQQFGMFYTSAAKAGFITGLYLILVPIIGILLRHSTGLTTWIGAGLAFIGLYFLSVNNDLSMSLGDSLLFLSALFWSFHILAIDHFGSKLEPIPFAAMQFLICGVASLAISLTIETPTLAAALAGWQPIFYAGFISVGIAYTLQVIAQAHAHPTHAAIIMSLEAVFAAIGGVWLLNEQLSPRAWFGCSLMMVGMLVSQMRWKKEL